MENVRVSAEELTKDMLHECHFHNAERSFKKRVLKEKDFNLSLGSSNSNYLSSSLVDPSASLRLASHPNVEFTRGLKCS